VRLIVQLNESWAPAHGGAPRHGPGGYCLQAHSFSIEIILIKMSGLQATAFTARWLGELHLHPDASGDVSALVRPPRFNSAFGFVMGPVRHGLTLCPMQLHRLIVARFGLADRPPSTRCARPTAFAEPRCSTSGTVAPLPRRDSGPQKLSLGPKNYLIHTQALQQVMLLGFQITCLGARIARAQATLRAGLAGSEGSSRASALTRCRTHSTHR
jgi:hypothetical protein